MKIKSWTYKILDCQLLKTATRHRLGNEEQLQVSLNCFTFVASKSMKVSQFKVISAFSNFMLEWHTETKQKLNLQSSLYFLSGNCY